jgi:hypothetical protein
MPFGDVLRALTRAMHWVGGRLLDFLTARSVVVISTTCAVLYGAFWFVGVLQANGLVSTALPIAVADEVILRRSGAQLHSAAALNQEQQAQRERTLAAAQTASDDPSNANAASRVTLEVETAPPVDLWVFDDSGNGVGTNPETGLVRLQIASAAYSGKGTSPQLVSIPHASGTYHIQLASKGTGHFNLRVRSFIDDDVSNATEYSGGGDVFLDTLLQSDASVGMADDGTPKMEVSSVGVVLAGDVPPPSPSPSPSLQASPDGQVAAAEAVPPAVVVPAPIAVRPLVPPRAPVVFRPQPVPQPPVPLPPAPALPAAIVSAIAPAPSPALVNSASPPPAGTYGSAGNALRVWQPDMSVRDGLRVSEAILRDNAGDN